MAALASAKAARQPRQISPASSRSSSMARGNGVEGDLPMLGDVDGDGLSDLFVWRRPSGTWFWLTSSSGYNVSAAGSKQWGNQAAGDVPLLTDLDGDDIVDLTVWRAPTGTWYWLQSTTGYAY